MKLGWFGAGALSAACVGALWAGLAWAQPKSDGSDDIVVPGGRDLRQIVRTFVDDISAPTREGQLPRWDRKVCPGVVGAENGPAQAIIDRIATRAVSVGLEIGQPGCRANVLIIVVPFAQRFTPRFVEQNEALFSRRGDNGVTRGGAALWEFTNVDRPVRWWHVSQVVTDRGKVMGQSDARTSGDGSLKGAQVARVSNTGRLNAGTRNDFNRVIIIVDSRDAADAAFSALADYVAMVSLAQISPTAEFGQTPTILSLFKDLESQLTPPDGWTAWDQSYLEGLYDAPRFARSSNQQENAITGSIMQTPIATDRPQSPEPGR